MKDQYQSAATQSQVSSSWYSWFTLVIVSLFFFYEYGLNNIFNSLEEPLSAAFHLNSVEIGFISSIYFYSNIIFLIPAAILLDRFSPRNLISVAMLVCSSAVLAVALTHSVWVLAISRFVMGIGGGFCVIGCMRIAASWFPSTKMARASSIVVAVGMIGGFVVQLPVTVLINHFGWREATGMFAGLGYVITIVIFWIVRDVPKHYQARFTAHRQELHQLGIWNSIKVVFSNRQNWSCALFASMINLPIYIVGALWGIPFLMEVHHLSNTDAATISSMLFLGTLVGCLAVGALSDLIRRRKLPMLLGVFASMVLIYMILNGSAFSFWTLLILFFLLGVSTSVQVLSYPTVTESNPRMVASTAVSVLSISFMVVGAVGQPLFGKLLSLGWTGAMAHGVPVYDAHHYLFAMNILPIAFVLSLIGVLLIKETRCTRALVKN